MSKKYPLRVIKGGFAPADRYTQDELRDKGFHLNDLVYAQITKPRNPQFNRLVHAFGRLVSENIDGFEHLDSHSVLKRLQIEGNIACKEIGIIFPGLGPTTYRIPKSLSFASMDEAEFSDTFKQFCRYVAEKYWKDLDPSQIEEMAQVMAQE